MTNYMLNKMLMGSSRPARRRLGGATVTVTVPVARRRAAGWSLRRDRTTVPGRRADGDRRRPRRVAAPQPGSDWQALPVAGRPGPDNARAGRRTT